MPRGDDDGADDQGRAGQRRGRRALAEEQRPERDGDEGFTYWCVTTCEIGAFRRSHAYALNPTTEPTIAR